MDWSIGVTLTLVSTPISGPTLEAGCRPSTGPTSLKKNSSSGVTLGPSGPKPGPMMLALSGSSISSIP